MIIFFCYQEEAVAVHDTDNRNGQNSSQHHVEICKSSILEDNEKSRLLQKLLQSKNPEDLQAANRLIKTMVKEVCCLLLSIAEINNTLPIY